MDETAGMLKDDRKKYFFFLNLFIIGYPQKNFDENLEKFNEKSTTYLLHT